MKFRISNISKKSLLFEKYSLKSNVENFFVSELSKCHLVKSKKYSDILFYVKKDLIGNYVILLQKFRSEKNKNNFSVCINLNSFYSVLGIENHRHATEEMFKHLVEKHLNFTLENIYFSVGSAAQEVETHLNRKVFLEIQ